MSKYLYGASIQGIQSFIFQTNKLKEIVGASELVNQICSSTFQEFLGQSFNDKNLIIGAAGNIKYIFESEEELKRVFSSFPRTIMEMAPGITVGQAVVKLEKFSESLQKLEDMLKAQRNIQYSTFLDRSQFMINEPSRTTGGAGIWGSDLNQVIDHSQKAKLEQVKKANSKLIKTLVGEVTDLEIAYDTKDLLEKNAEKSWIAVVHADGNNLGLILQNIYTRLNEEQIPIVYKKFSSALDRATLNSAKTAYSHVEKQISKRPSKKPIRPLILGGDDLTVIIRGELAIPFTEKFLEEFEKQTQKEFSKLENDENISIGLSKGLTACAGIAFIKTSYPFHYGSDLADDLCKHAKTVSKKISKGFTPSSLAFQKVHSSFIGDYKSIIKRELTCPDGLRFDFGPYFLKEQEGFATISQLKNWVMEINRPTAPKSGIREWLGNAKSNPETAGFLMTRIRSKSGKFIDSIDLSEKNIFQKRDNNLVTHLYDVIQLSNISSIDHE
jgi:hypothetical protein